MKKGYYFWNTFDWVRCYYLTGEKAGNKWIAIKEHENIPNPEWWPLNWMCIPKEEELKNYEYHTENPTRYERI